MPFTQQEQLNEAAKADNLDEVKSFFSADPDDLPSQNDIDDALDAAVKTKSQNVIHYFFTKSSPSPSGEEIAATFITLCKSKDFTTLLPMIKRCIKEMPNKPKSEVIDEVLAATVKAMDWAYMKTLCELEGDMAPSSKGIDSVLSTLLRVGMQQKITVESSQKWEGIQYLSSLEGTNQPTRQVINSVVTTAIKAKSMEADFKFRFLYRLCTMKSNNAPSREELVKILLISPAQVKTPLKLVKAVCKHSKNKPNTQDMSDAVERLLKNSPILWESVKYLCFEAPVKPDFVALEAALAAALTNDILEIVKLFCESKPALLSPDDLQGALAKAKHHEEKEGHQSFCAAVLYLEEQLAKPADKEFEVVELNPNLSAPLQTHGFFQPQDQSQQQPKPQPTPTNSKVDEEIGCSLGELFCMGFYNCLAALYWAFVYLASCFPSCANVDVEEKQEAVSTLS